MNKIKQLVTRNIKSGQVAVDELIALGEDGCAYEYKKDSNSWIKLADLPEPKKAESVFSV